MVSQVVVTRPRHPLEGRTLRMLGRMRRHGRVELLLVLPDGSKSLIPADWTDLEPAAVETGPATVGTRADLGHAVALAAELLTRARQAQVQAAQRPPGQEDHHAACTAEFAARPDRRQRRGFSPACPNRRSQRRSPSSPG